MPIAPIIFDPLFVTRFLRENCEENARKPPEELHLRKIFEALIYLRTIDHPYQKIAYHWWRVESIAKERRNNFPRDRRLARYKDQDDDAFVAWCKAHIRSVPRIDTSGIDFCTVFNEVDYAARAIRQSVEACVFAKASDEGVFRLSWQGYSETREVTM